MAGFSHINAEYEEAVALLKATFGKPKKQIESRLHAVFYLKTPSSTATELGHFRAIYEGHLRGLEVYEPKSKKPDFSCQLC